MKLKKHAYYLSCALTAACLLTISWQPFGFFIAVFIGFIPLLFLERKIREYDDHAGIFFFYISLSLFCWNAATTFWIWNASPEGAIAAFVINMLMMGLPFMVYHRMQKRVHDSRAEWIFIYCWIGFEFWHLNWDLSWPWLTLGNVFSTVPSLVQWYEYTGHLGGSFWVLYVNLRLFRYITQFKERSRMMNFSKAFNLLFFTVFAPAFLSYYLLLNYREKPRALSVVVVQPNIDPYKDKFDQMTPYEQTQKMLRIAEEKMDSSVQLVVFPETAVMGNLNEDQLNRNESIQLIKQFVQKYPGIVVLSGADTYKFYKDPASRSETARRYEGDEYYDSYNTALLIDGSSEIQIYHKSKLVPGVEKMPYPKLFSFLEKLTLELGGTSGSLGHDDEPKVFTIQHHYKVAPVICYESAYGEYVGEYIRKDADLICVVTNDGWWGNTPGYQQHFDYARLRAVETRKYVARSANTGISGFIDAKGNVLDKTKWWEDAALKTTVNLNPDKTFYAEHGDYIGRIAGIMALINILIYWRKRELEDYTSS
jgi:apolipoprotein N-acyltransferase